MNLQYLPNITFWIYPSTYFLTRSAGSKLCLHSHNAKRTSGFNNQSEPPSGPTTRYHFPYFGDYKSPWKNLILNVGMDGWVHVMLGKYCKFIKFEFEKQIF